MFLSPSFSNCKIRNNKTDGIGLLLGINETVHEKLMVHQLGVSAQEISSLFSKEGVSLDEIWKHNCKVKQ